MCEDMEEVYVVVVDDGVQIVILCGGDFIECVKIGNWFDIYIV